jgi:hypothetical protein
MGGDIATWAVNHGEAQTTPPLLAVISALKSSGVKQIAATGYCFGGMPRPSSNMKLLNVVKQSGLYITRLVQGSLFLPIHFHSY